jgi:hypothetical protein
VEDEKHRSADEKVAGIGSGRPRSYWCRSRSRPGDRESECGHPEPDDRSRGPEAIHPAGHDAGDRADDNGWHPKLGTLVFSRSRDDNSGAGDAGAAQLASAGFPSQTGAVQRLEGEMRGRDDLDEP